MLKLKSLLSSGFVRNVSVLAGGTAFAQALALLALPLLTRLYTAEEFGVLGVFVALLGMISVMANLRYEIAIPLPESDECAANLLAVALVCGVFTSFVVSVTTFVYGAQIGELIGSPLLARYLWLLPIGVSLTSAYAVFQFWATRKKAFRRIAGTRMEQAIGGVSTQALLGLAGVGAWGLIVGQIVNNGAGFVGLAWRALKEDRALLRSISWVEMKSAAREYHRFPKYSTVEALANMAAVQLPLILIASMVAGAELGYLMLGMRLMQAPVGLVGSSINQVYFSRAIEQHRGGHLAELTAAAVGSLAKIGVGPLVFAGIVAPALFGSIFGAGWERAGVLVAWMTPWFVFQFLSQPVSMALHVTSHQGTALIIHVLGFIMRVSTVLVISRLSGTERLSECYAVSGFVFYLGYLCAILLVARVSLRSSVEILANAIPFVVPWVVIGVGVRFVLDN